MPKGIPNKKYTGEFKQMVVETMRKELLSYQETARRFEVRSDTQVRSWERHYLPENGGVRSEGRFIMEENGPHLLFTFTKELLELD